jgi:DNA polymerase-3 subunit delta
LTTRSSEVSGGHDQAVLVISQEPFLLMQEEERFRERLIPPEARDLNLRILYGWEAGVVEIVEFLQTLPFLAERRLLVLREVQTLKDHEQLTAYLKDPNPSSCLLMTSSELKRTDSRFKAISSLARSSELKKPTGAGMAKWVANRFARAGKSIDLGLAEVLVQIVGGDLSILATEIDKVVLSSGEREQIVREDLSVSVPGGVEGIFNFLDALGDGDCPTAVAAGKKLLEDGNPPEYLVHMLAWHYRQLIRGRELVDSGLSPGKAAEKMGKRYPAFRDKFARQIGRATEDGLIRAMGTLSACDLELKRGRIPAGILLDRLVLDLFR